GVRGARLPVQEAQVPARAARAGARARRHGGSRVSPGDTSVEGTRRYLLVESARRVDRDTRARAARMAADLAPYIVAAQQAAGGAVRIDNVFRANEVSTDPSPLPVTVSSF